MAEIQLNRQAAESGQLPNVCLCCGAPATQLVQHKFYLRSTGILIAMLLLGKMRWLFLPQSYEYSEFRVPLCSFHRHRLSLHTYLLIGFAILGLLCVPVLLIGSINKDYVWVTEIGLVLFLLLFPVMFCSVLTVMILTPRMVEQSTVSIKLVSVSNGFAQALRSGGTGGTFASPSPMPGLPAQAAASGPGLLAGFNLQLGLITAGVCLLSLMEYGVIHFGSSLISGAGSRPVMASNTASRQQWDEQVRREQEESRRRMEEFNRRMRSSPATSPNRPPSYTPPTSPVPSPSPPSSGETRPGGKLSPTNQNNRNYIPSPSGQPGLAVTNPAQVKAGDKVHIYWGGSWYPGVVRGTEYGLIKIHYDNHPDSWDELASLQRVRLVSSVANSPTPAFTPPAPSIPAPAIPTPPAPSIPTPSIPAPPPQVAQMRTWTDSTGKHKLEAKLIGREGDNVKLERPDGKIVTMPLDQLSPADQVVVRAKYP